MSSSLPLPHAAQQIIDALHPHEVRVVGGWVRTYITSAADAHTLARNECDLATTATPDEAEALLKAAGCKISDPGRRWGSLIVTPPQENPDQPGESIELTTLRTEEYLAGSRYPTVAWTTDWAHDAARRDFTINAIYLAPDGTLFDPYNGQSDLAENLVCFIGDAPTRLSEDPLRWLRFWRFCAQYGLAGATPEMIDILITTAPGLGSLSRSRVQAEWNKLQRGAWAGNVMDALRHHNLLAYVQSRLETAS